ncbi:hypothetical protein D0W74_23120 [Escherichia coli]|nr:hypothetical protein [Escherichia coli]
MLHVFMLRTPFKIFYIIILIIIIYMVDEWFRFFVFNKCLSNNSMYFFWFNLSILTETNK